MYALICRFYHVHARGATKNSAALRCGAVWGNVCCSGPAPGDSALDELDELDDGDDADGEAQGDEVLAELHAGEVESVGNEGHLADEGRGDQAAESGQLRVLFMLCSVKMLPRCERMLKLWKISAMLMVTKAMVVPSGLSAISQTPDSM